MTKRNHRNPRNPPAKAPAKVLRLDAVDVAFGGDGIAREDGKVIFIEGAVPGETVEALILQDKKSFARARSLKTLIPAADAVAPFCPVFSRCGGCDWQHVPYEKQLRWKQSFIETALSKNARLTWPEPIAIRPSADIRNFRNRIKLKARVHRGSFEFGYFAKGSHELVRIEGCPIAETAINDMIKELRALPFPVALAWDGELEIQRIGNQDRLLHFNPPFPDLPFLKNAFPKDTLDEPGTVSFESQESVSYRTRAGQFQQVNVKGNHELRDWIRAKVGQIKPKTLVDLFCGSGNLSLGLKGVGEDLKVWGIEYSAAAIQTAEENLKENGFTGFTYRAGAAKDIRLIMGDLPDRVDCVITDPPRQGMDDSIDDLLALKPKHILSVSCDPNTFARDLKVLLGRGYVLKEISGIDFFPHSYHIETLAHLEWDPNGGVAPQE